MYYVLYLPFLLITVFKYFYSAFILFQFSFSNFNFPKQHLKFSFKLIKVYA